MDESWTLVINLAKTDTYILVQKSMLHLFPVIITTRLNPPTNTRTNDHADMIYMIVMIIRLGESEKKIDRW